MLQPKLTETEFKLFRQLSTYSAPFFPADAHRRFGNGEDYWEWFFKAIYLVRTGLFKITETTRPPGVPITFELTDAGKLYLDGLQNRHDKQTISVLRETRIIALATATAAQHITLQTPQSKPAAQQG